MKMLVDTLIDQDCAEAMFNYADMIEKGLGFPENNEEVCKYYKMAADKGHSLAIEKYSDLMANRNEIDKKQNN